MTITKEQLERRKNYIGSSEVATVMGVNPYENAYDLWLEKTGKLERERTQTEDMKLGKHFERVALELAENELGAIDTIAQRLEFIIESAHIISHPDGLRMSGLEPIEAKESGIRNPFYAKENWGEPHTDQVPDMVLVQAQVHIMATKKTICHIPTILGGRGYVIFFVPETQWLQERILNEVGKFWDDHIIKDIPPENILPTMDSIKRRLRVPKKIIDIPDTLALAWIEINKRKTEIEKLEELLKRQVANDLGDAEAARFSEGIITHYQQHKKAYEVAESTFRVLRFKKGRDL